MTQTAARLTGSVHHLCFVTVGGELVLAAARNSGVELIDPDDGTVLRVIAPERPANATRGLSRDGGSEILLAGGSDGVLYGYDPSDGRLVVNRPLGTGSVKDLEILGDRVAAVLDSGLVVWDPDRDAVVRLPDPADMDPARLFKVCAYPLAGREWLVGAYTDGYLATWDVADPRADPVVQHAHDGPITEPHSHSHRHEPMRHKHVHYPDLHHRHGHG